MSVSNARSDSNHGEKGGHEFSRGNISSKYKNLRVAHLPPAKNRNLQSLHSS